MQYVKRSSNRSHLTGRDHLYIYSDIINFEEIPILIGGLAIDWPKFYRCVAPHKCRAWHKIISKMDQPPTAAINNKWSVIVCVCVCLVRFRHLIALFNKSLFAKKCDLSHSFEAQMTQTHTRFQPIETVSWSVPSPCAWELMCHNFVLVAAAHSILIMHSPHSFRHL